MSGVQEIFEAFKRIVRLLGDKPEEVRIETRVMEP